MISITQLDVALALMCLFVLKALFTRMKQRAPLPPGPKGLPLIGNIFDMPASHEWYKFAEWSQLYGDLVFVNLLGQPIIILGSIQHAVALLDKRSTLYSDRPKFTMAGELAGFDQGLALTPYTSPRFREYRRMGQKLLGSRILAGKCHRQIEYETKKWLKRTLDNPASVAKQIRKLAGSIILQLTHGYEVLEGEDPVATIVDHAMEDFSDAVAPGAFLVDVFPLLRYVPSWVPGAGFQKKAREWRQNFRAMADVPHNLVKQRMNDGTNVPNLTSELLQEDDLDEDKEELIKWTAASIYSGGSDTTVSAIYSFFLAMTLHPEVQERAQSEIDSVVGPDRLPCLEDRKDLPYVEALLSEVLRWNPVGPLGVPHSLVEDDVYEGYLIPKGSIVIPNIWQFLHDPEAYGPNPYVFDPSRFLGETPAPDPRNCCFGFGRRICPGMHLADASMFIACAMALAVFNIRKVVKDGHVVEPKVEYTTGTISHPKPFPCDVKPRSGKAEALISAELDDMFRA